MSPTDTREKSTGGTKKTGGGGGKLPTIRGR